MNLIPVFQSSSGQVDSKKSQLARIKAPGELEGRSFVPLLDDVNRPWKKAATSQFLRYGKWMTPGSVPYMGYTIRTPMLDHIRAVEGGDYAHAADPADIAKTVLAMVAPFEQTTTGQVVDRDGKSVM